MERRNIKLTAEDIRAIESVLSNDDRVELVPVRDGGVKVLHIKRETVKVRN